jgi:hypothetical protein
MQDYRTAVDHLDSLVKRSRHLMGKEFDDEHERIEQAEKACERARRAMHDYLGRGES